VGGGNQGSEGTLTILWVPSGARDVRSTMRLYGSVRHDVARCVYGCCGGKLTAAYKGDNRERAGRKQARKRARREGRKATLAAQ